MLYISSSAFWGHSLHPECISQAYPPLSKLPTLQGSRPGSPLPILLRHSPGRTPPNSRNVYLSTVHSSTSHVKMFTCIFTLTTIQELNYELPEGRHPVISVLTSNRANVLPCGKHSLSVEQRWTLEMSLNKTMCFLLKDSSLWSYFLIGRSGFNILE